jgi:hypothetical protein
MNALIAAELLKLRTTRALWVATVAVVVFSAFVPAVVAIRPDGVTIPEVTGSLLAELLRAPASLAGGAVLLVGLLAATAEFRHHTVLTTRLVEPRQLRVLAAKILAMGAVGLLLGVLVEVVAGVGGAIALGVNDVAVDPLADGVPRVAGTVPLLLALHGMAGVAIGALSRNTAAAVGVTFLWVFVIEGVVPVVTRRPEIVHWLPGGAIGDVLAAETAGGALVPWAAGALLAAYAVALAAAAAAVDTRREV